MNPEESAAVAYAVRRRGTPGTAGPPSVVRERRYSRAEVLDAVRRWACKYGEAPTSVDWEPARARRMGHNWRAERFEDGRWPTVRVVCGHFGTFNDAVRLAGLQPRRAPARLRPNLAGPEAILEALVEWTRRYGDIPAMADWDPVRARRLGQAWRIARYREGDWPSARSVAHHFGSFAAAVTAAGLIPRPRSSTVESRADAPTQPDRDCAGVRRNRRGGRCRARAGRAGCRGEPGRRRPGRPQRGPHRRGGGGGRVCGHRRRRCFSPHLRR